MTFAFALALAQTSPKITMQLFQDEFVIRKGAAKELVPLKADLPKPPVAAVFRKDKTFAVWDDRGLTIRTGKRFVSTKLKEIATSPKVSAREQILANIELFKAGKRSKEASALSGARRIGTEAFFLVRWDDTSGQPWLEALVSVDLAEKKPEWHLVGKFEGLSTARQQIDSKLMLHNGTLAVVTRKDDAWGESFYSANMRAFGFKRLGARLMDFRPGVGLGGTFIEQTSYGTLVGGRVNLVGEQRMEAFEARGTAKFADDQDPLLAIITEHGTQTIRNTETGALMPLPGSCGIRRTSAGVVIWSPLLSPTKAVLYDSKAWKALSRWDQTASKN